MIGGRVGNVVECLAGHGDYMLLAKSELLGCLETERKALGCPTENGLPNLAPLWAYGNFSTNGSDCVSVGIFKRDMNVAVCLNF